MNILVIAGYNVLADRPEFGYHQYFMSKSCDRAVREGADLILTIGGATNPDYPNLTEAGTAKKIVDGVLFSWQGKIQTEAIPIGNTSAETLRAVREYLKGKDIHQVQKLIYCVELSRSVGFGMDGLFEGLNQLCQELVICGFRFPESEGEFKNQKKKLLVKLLSHRSWLFRRWREIYQKLHQKRVARIVRNKMAIKPPRRS